MDVGTLAWVTGGVLVVAMLYAAVGHAGASGYIAVMTLAGWAPNVVKPTALMLNLLVAALATWQFAPYFEWRRFWPFALLALPLAFIGGYLTVPPEVFRRLVGGVLWASAVRIWLPRPAAAPVTLPPLRLALPGGAGIGLLSGLTGTGGGIFLTPLLLLARWAETKTASAVSAAFILGNSLSGLLGYVPVLRLCRLLSGRCLWRRWLAAGWGRTSGAGICRRAVSSTRCRWYCSSPVENCCLDEISCSFAHGFVLDRARNVAVVDRLPILTLQGGDP